MTSRERIQAAFAHREGDRVPLFEMSIAADTASEILGGQALTGMTYLRYREAAAWMRGPEAHGEFLEQMTHDVAALARAMSLDMVHCPWRLGSQPSAQLDEHTFLFGDPDGDYTVRRFDPEAQSFDAVEHHSAAPPIRDPDELEPQVESAERHAISPGPIDPNAAYPWHVAMMARYGDEFEISGAAGLGLPYDSVWLMACAERPDLVARLLDARVAMVCRQLEAQAALGIRYVCGGGEMAGGSGPIYGPRVFREIVLPRVKRVVARCHQLGQTLIFCTNGCVWPIERELFVDSGIDGYGYIDHESGMDMARLKARHGDRITFWGNVPCSSLLHNGTPAQVEEFTQRLIDVGAPGGGLLVGSSNYIVPGTPARNVMAMVDTALRYGRY